MKKLLLVILALTLSAGLWAETITNVKYIDANGIEQTCPSATVVTNETTTLSGWNVVLGSDVQTGTLTCNGAVHLILADGAKLTARGKEQAAGINVSGEVNSLTIYGQTAQSGQLIAMSIDGAGIGGGNAQSGSNITINGGMVTATSDSGAGIGGGSNGNGSNITINGGTVNATSEMFGAGIGGGKNAIGSNITINGGTVTATAADRYAASGIGSGGKCDNYSSNIFVATTLNVATGNSTNFLTEIVPDHTSSTDIANDLAGKCVITIGNEMFPVTYGDNITVSPQFESGVNVVCGGVITFTAPTFSTNGCEFAGFYKERTFKTPITEGVSGQTYTATVTNAPISVYAKYLCSYIDVNGLEQRVAVSFITNHTRTLPAGWYVVASNDVSTGSLICNGTVHLILADGSKLTATGGEGQAGIQVSGGVNSLTIYGQANQTGELKATGGYRGAGIGGYSGAYGGGVTINGGKVNATGGVDGAGIGGGYAGIGSNITINGGVVNAQGLEGGAGIGGGCGYPVESHAEDDGYTGSANNIFIYGGTVNAVGGNKGGAGIGGGWGAYGGSIAIYGGTVTATGGYKNIAAIGGGQGLYGSNITVSEDCQVFADDNNPPTTKIEHDSDQDLASYLGVRYALIKNDPAQISQLQNEASSAIDEVIDGVTNAYILSLAQTAKNEIQNATNRKYITAIKDAVVVALTNLIKGLDLGKAEAFGELGTPQTGCAAVKVTKDDKEVILYAPDNVKVIKIPANN